MAIDLSKIGKKEEQTLYTKKDLVIPAGTKLTKWSSQEKDEGFFSMVYGIGNNFAGLIKLDDSDIIEIEHSDPEFLTEKENK